MIFKPGTEDNFSTKLLSDFRSSRLLVFPLRIYQPAAQNRLFLRPFKKMKSTEPVVHSWERWPFWLIYFPLSFVWLYYIIRARAVWFFTPSNPTITFGGMQGETKSEMYARLPKEAYATTVVIQPKSPFEEVLRKIEEQQISWPFVVKPDVGEAGILFRKIDTVAQLHEYHLKVKAAYLVQNMILYPIEVSVFYYRMPNENSGTITGFLHKVPMHVLGDGKSTLRQLVDQHPKAAAFFAEIEKVHAGNFEKVLPVGEKYIFSHAANHRRGARFHNLQNEIDDTLLALFDKISQQAGGWYYGRYDVMCQSVDDLKEGRNFCLLEYNGCGAEPNHIYDSGYTLGQAYREILKHWAALYRISRYNTKQGIKTWPLFKGWRFIRQAKKTIRQEVEMEKTLSF